MAIQVSPGAQKRREATGRFFGGIGQAFRNFPANIRAEFREGRQAAEAKKAGVRERRGITPPSAPVPRPLGPVRPVQREQPTPPAATPPTPTPSRTAQQLAVASVPEPPRQEGVTPPAPTRREPAATTPRPPLRQVPAQTGTQRRMSDFTERARARGFEINPATGEVIDPTPELIAEFNREFATAREPLSRRERLQQDVLGTFDITPAEQRAQEQLDVIAARRAQQQVGEATGQFLAGQQPIPLGLITGQQEAIAQRGILGRAALAAEELPLTQRIAREQQAREQQRARAEAELGFLPGAAEPVTVAPGAALVDPQTGETIFQAPFKPGAVRSQVTEKNGRNVIVNLDTGETIADLGEVTPEGGVGDLGKLLTIKEAEALGVPFGTTRGEVVGTVPGEAQKIEAGRRLASQIDRVVGNVDEALALVPQTAGLGAIGRVAASRVPGTDSFDLEQIVGTVKANLGFDTLQAMRDASPTGGALGQVSEREIDFLQSTVESLNLGLSTELLQENLEAVKTHYNNWKATLEEAGRIQEQEAATITDRISEAEATGASPEEILPFLQGDPEVGEFVRQATEEGKSAQEIIDFLKKGRAATGVSPGTRNPSGRAGNRPQRNANPGNVKRGGVADRFAMKDAGGKVITDEQDHLVFPTPDAGFQGLRADLRAKITGRSRFVKSSNPTIAELGKAFAEDPNWPRRIAQLTGTTTNTKAQAIPFETLVQAVATQEGFFARG